MCRTPLPDSLLHAEILLRVGVCQQPAGQQAVAFSSHRIPTGSAIQPHEAGALDKRRNLGTLPHGFREGVAGKEPDPLRWVVEDAGTIGDCNQGGDFLPKKNSLYLL